MTFEPSEAPRGQERYRLADRGRYAVGELATSGVLASAGTVGDAHDNTMAESFVDTFKTELIADRVWRSPSQLEINHLEDEHGLFLPADGEG